MLHWIQTYPTRTPAQASRLADICTVLVEENIDPHPGDMRLAALTGVRAYMDAGLRETAREFFRKHIALLTSHDCMILRIELGRSERGALVLEGLRG